MINPHEAALKGTAYMDGEYCPLSEARINVMDWGFLRSDATYDVAHVWKGRFFRLDRHIDRFLQSVDALRMQLPVNRDELTEILMECVRRAGLQDAYVEMVCTRGIWPPASRDPRDAINRFFAFAAPLGSIASAEQRERGLDLYISSVRRIPPESVDPTVKNYHWLDFVRGLYDAYEHGGENVVLTDFEDNVTEGPGFNVFAVKNGRVSTPDRGMLEGVTRGTVLELCEELGIPAAAEPVAARYLRAADEAFITSTVGGVMPVGRVDGQALKGGPITGQITKLYWEKHTDPGWSTPVPYE